MACMAAQGAPIVSHQELPNQDLFYLIMALLHIFFLVLHMVFFVLLIAARGPTSSALSHTQAAQVY